MDLAVKRTALKNENRNLPVNERAMLSCELSKQLEKIGEYEKAYEALVEFWPDRTEPPNVEGLDEPTKAEVLLRAGALEGWLGGADQTEGSQERAKNLITKSIEIFDALSDGHHAAEARGELALCYWREGGYDEARITLATARSFLGDNDAELKAILLIRASIVEMQTQKLQEAMRYCDEAALLVEQSEDHALRGSFHIQYGLILRHLATPENREDYLDRALIEYAAASVHFEAAGNVRALARVENNLGFLYFTIGQYKDAHSHLDRARNLFSELNDIGTVAQVDETRARTLLAEGRPREAERVIKMAVKTLEKGGQQALMAESLTTQATISARLGSHSRARALFQRAIEVAETCGDLEGAGRARLSVIEELGNQTQAEELASILYAAADLLQNSQDPSARKRLVGCALKTIDVLLAEIKNEPSLAGKKSWENFSLKREIKKIESRFIERALRDAGGSVSTASRLLGFRHHQSLIALLGGRHSELQDRRSIKRRRRHPLLAKTKPGKRTAPAPGNQNFKLSILHVEDHRVVARLVGDMLRAEEMSVDLCASGIAAWEILKGKAHYDALVVDSNLPGLSGLELVLRVRSMPHRRNLPTIMLSADDCEKEAWRAGVDAFLRKPQAVDQLTSTIARVVAERRKN